MTVLLFAAALCLTLSVLAIANVATMPARARRARIRSAATYGNLGKTETVERTRFSERVVGPSIGWLSRAMLRLNPKQSLESIDALLMSAGMRNWTAQAFLASKGAAGIGGVVLGFVLGSAKSAAAAFVFALILGAVGYIAPAIIIQAKGRKRGNQLSGDLPDALDLLAVSVEAGLGFDAAVAKLTPVHERAALGRVRARARRDADRREPRRRAEEARRTRGHAGDRRVRPRDHPGRPARHVARPHPPRPGDRHAPEASGVRRRSGR